MIENVLSLLGKIGTTATGIVIICGGLIVLLPYFGVPVYVAQGISYIGIGLGVIIGGHIYTKSEAEKRLSNPSLPSSSAVPAIQTQIDKIKRETNP